MNDSLGAPPRLAGSSIELRNRVLCAPICGATKVPYRLLARAYGADLCYTEMIKAVAIVRGNERSRARSFELAARDPAETPVGVQICGANPREMGEAARILADRGFDTIDINMGCPVPKVVKEGAGAALLRDPSQVARVVEGVVSAVDLPVTIKIRSGWSQDETNAVLVSRAAEEAGARMITIHGRARTQRHSGSIDYALVAEVKQSVSIPVVGNGGILSGADALQMVEQTGCDAVMIGRGGYGRPWIFGDCARALRGDLKPYQPDAAELGRIMWQHFEGTLSGLGETIGVRTFRRYASWYFKDRPYGSYFRDLAFRSKTKEELEKIVRSWIDYSALCEKTPEDQWRPRPPDSLEELFRGAAPAWMRRSARIREETAERAREPNAKPPLC